MFGARLHICMTCTFSQNMSRSVPNSRLAESATLRCADALRPSFHCCRDTPLHACHFVLLAALTMTSCAHLVSTPVRCSWHIIHVRCHHPIITARKSPASRCCLRARACHKQTSARPCIPLRSIQYCPMLNAACRTEPHQAAWAFRFASSMAPHGCSAVQSMYHLAR